MDDCEALKHRNELLQKKLAKVLDEHRRIDSLLFKAKVDVQAAQEIEDALTTEIRNLLTEIRREQEIAQTTTIP